MRVPDTLICTEITYIRSLQSLTAASTSLMYVGLMDIHDKFIDLRRTRLLEYLDPDMRDRLEEHPLTFVTGVLDEWLDLFGTSQLPAPSLAERAFWFALYQLEELEELKLMVDDDPMMIFLEAHLEQMRAVLAAGEDIPPGFWATRPNGDMYVDEFDDMPAADDIIH